MAITTGDQYIAAAKQVIPFTKTASVTTIAATRFGVFATAGNPGAGTAAMAATPGAVPDDTVAGYPSVNTFGASAVGYVTRVQYANSVAGRLELWDRLYGLNVSLTALATTTITSPPSYSARLPGTSYVGLRLFVEITTAVSATATTVQVNYTNQAGTAARATAATASLSGFTANRLVELPLQAGDTGIQKLESVTVGGTVATAGAVNVIVLRPLWTGRVAIANDGNIHGLDKTGMPQVYDTSALFLTVVADSTSSGIPDLNIEIANA